MSKDGVLPETILRERLRQDCPAWQIEDGAIIRRVRSGGWRRSLDLANAIGNLADQAWHHPELVVTFGSLTIRLTTHSAGGITEKDLALASRIDALVDERA